MDFFYDGQIRRYVTQFMRIFIGFKYQAGDMSEQTVPVMYGDLSRQVAALIRENSENKMPTVPRIACYITGMEMDKTRLSDPTFVSKINVRERDFTFDEANVAQYTGAQGNAYTVERLLPTPFMLNMKADIWTSNTDQKLQLLEQMLVLFNPSLGIQATDNYIDWTSLSVVDLVSTNFSSRAIPVGVDSDVDICSLDFTMPIYISPPTKVKKLGIVRSVIANIFTESGDVTNLSDLIYDASSAQASIYANARYGVLLFKANNNQAYDYELTIIDNDEAVNSLGLQKEVKSKTTEIDWTAVLDKLGGFKAGSRIYFMQPTGFEMVGSYAVNPVNPKVLLVTFDQDTIPTNTSIASTVNGVAAKSTVDAIIDPYKFNPIATWGSYSAIPLGTRYLVLDDINDSENVGQSYRETPYNEAYDGPDAWQGTTGNDPVIVANSIIEWNGTDWITLKDPNTLVAPTYFQNLKTGIQYKWTGTEWLKSFEGEYSSGFWRIDPNPS
jgi:hypothetical protein